MVEIWKEVKGFEKYYLVSTFGRVKSIKSQKILKQSIGSDGYLKLNLSKKTKSVHRLVGETFLINEKNKETINHKDKNRLNNSLENLEWMTQYQNNRHKNNLPDMTIFTERITKEIKKIIN
jgi:hypothetical protein